MDLLRKGINLWLVAVAADGGLRVLAGLIEAITGSTAFGMAVFPFELVAVIGMVILWFATAISSRVPVRVVLPPMVAICWMFLGALPFTVLFYNQPGFQISVGLTLLLSVGLSEGLARTAGHGRWLLQADPFGDDLEFTPRRLLGWVAGWSVIGPTASALYLVAGIAWTLWWGTNGFVVATPTGLAVAHKTYVQGDDTVDLIGMIHLGEEHAYDELFDAIPKEGAVVLAEGISDRENLIGAPRDAYGKAASQIGLSAQAPAEVLFHGFEVRNADVDVSEFDPVSVELLNVALGMYAAGDDPNKAIADYLGFWMKHRSDTRQVTDQLFDDILESRNAHLLAELDEAREERERVVLPWGALHMVGVSRALEERGWAHTDTRRVVLIRWATVFGRGR